jgi:fatty acid desaturase
MTWLLSRDLLGAGVVFFAMGLRDLWRTGRKENALRAEYPWPNVLRLTFLLALAGLIVASGRPLLFLYAWLASLLFILPAILRLRSVAEHFALPRQHVLNSTRNIHVTWWESFLLAPHHISLHLDHHLFPYVPWYRLPELHRRLSATGIYQSLAHNNLGFIAGSQSVFANVASIVDDPRTALAPTLTSKAAGA